MTPYKTSVLPLLLVLAGSSCNSPVDRERLRARTDWLYGTAAEHRTFAAVDRATDAPAVSHDDVQQRADLQSYLSYGLRESAALRAADQRWRAALERGAQVSAWPDPQFTFAQFVEELQTRTGPQQRRYSLTQPLPWFGELGRRGAVADAAAEEAWHDVLAVRLAVRRDIELAYHEYAYLAKSLDIMRATLELVRGLEPNVLRRIAGGDSGQEDLLRLQLEIGRRENDLASLLSVRASLSARLAAAMNWRGAGPLPMPELAVPSRRGTDVEQLMRRTLGQNPQLGKLTQTIAKNRQALELARIEKWPNFALGVDYLETGEAAAPTPGSGTDPWGLRLSASIPIGRGRIVAAEREAERNLSAASFALEAGMAKVRADLEHAVFQLDDAGRQVELYRETLLPRAQEALEVTRAAYVGGMATLLDLFDGERALLGFETAYWRACRDYHQSRARLEAIVGGAL